MSDYNALIGKIDAMMEQGVRHFAFFVDDVPEELAHESDRARFANLGEAHVYIINKLYDDLRARGAELIVCPTTYTDAWGTVNTSIFWVRASPKISLSSGPVPTSPWKSSRKSRRVTGAAS
jgi:hypothetical protein